MLPTYRAQTAGRFFETLVVTSIFHRRRRALGENLRCRPFRYNVRDLFRDRIVYSIHMQVKSPRVHDSTETPRIRVGVRRTRPEVAPGHYRNPLVFFRPTPTRYLFLFFPPNVLSAHVGLVPARFSDY